MNSFRELLIAIKPNNDALLLDFIEEDVIRCYFEYFRAYHTFDEHILPGLHLLNSVKGLCNNKKLVRLAWWYHDIIYVPGSSNSEIISADKAYFDCIQLDYDERKATTVHKLVMATQHFKTVPQTQDEKLIHDLDLATLGGEPEDYEKYVKLIREEYKFIKSDRIFSQGRLQILEKFLNRDSIFITKYFQDNFEKRARDNLRREINTIKLSFPAPE